MARDNFSKNTIDILAKRVSYICSNPTCKKITVGSNNIDNKSTVIGVAAHITAAASGGPRFNESLTAEQRSNINNGIWLCSNCASLIDKDANKYSVEILNEWKILAEKNSAQSLKGYMRNNITGTPFLEVDLININSGRYNQGYSDNNPTDTIDGTSFYSSTNKPIIHWEIEWRFNLVIINNSSYPAYNIQIESIGTDHFNYIAKLNKVNNLKPFQRIDLASKFTINLEGISTEADAVLKKLIPEKLKDLILAITYLDEERKEHCSLMKIVNGEVFNEKIT